MTLPQVGQIFGRYRIDDVIGRGGMGVVLGATDTGLGRRVALKVVAADLGGSEEFRMRFEREAATLARLASPHVIAIYDYGTQDDCPYIATQFVAGGDLGVYLRDRGPMTPGDALRVCAQIADALDDAHRAGVVHRDVKPTNVLVRDHDSDEPHVYLCDFGIARTGTDGLTQAGAVAGTWSYLAPENGRGVPASTSSDLYALGCLLWATLTGHPPYRGTDVEIALAHQRDPVPQLPGGSEVVRAVNAVLARAMAKERTDRYPDAGEMRTALLAAAQTPGADEPLPEIVDDPTMWPHTAYRSPTPGSAPGASSASSPSSASYPSYPSRPPSSPPSSPPSPQPSTPPAYASASQASAPQAYASQTPHPSGPARPARKGRGAVVAAVVVGVLVLAGGGVAAVTVLGGDDGTDPDPGPTSQASDPTGGPTSGATSGQPAVDLGPITGDLDGDGSGDLSVDYDPREGDDLLTTTWASDGTSAFVDPQTTDLGPRTGSPTWRVRGYLDDDDIADVLTFNQPGGQGPVGLSSELSGGGTIDTELDIQGRTSTYDALADVDGDGIDEILHLEVEGDSRIVLTSRAFDGTTFGEAQEVYVFTQAADNFAITPGDFDGDGSVDIATFTRSDDYDRGYPGTIEIRLGDGAGGLGDSITAPFTSTMSDLSLRNGDFDGDGSDELLAADRDTSFVTLNLFDLEGTSILPRINSGNIRYTSVAPNDVTVIDVNGDSLDDVASLTLNRQGGSGQVLTGVSNGTTFTSSVWLAWDQLFTARVRADDDRFETLEDARW